jgi:periplasmic copper chaperone A
MRRISFFFLNFILLCLTLTACAADAAVCPAGVKGISVTDVWMEPSTPASMPQSSDSGGSPSAGTSAAFMLINNCGAEADWLLSVSSDAAAMIQLHKTETRNGVSMMAMMEAIDIPAGKQVVLKAGDLHVMFMRLKNELKVGDTVNLTLNFEKAGAIPFQAPVKAP